MEGSSPVSMPGLTPAPCAAPGANTGLTPSEGRPRGMATIGIALTQLKDQRSVVGVKMFPTDEVCVDHYCAMVGGYRFFQLLGIWRC